MLHKKPLIGVSVDCYQGLSPSMLIGALKIIGINFVEVTTSVFNETDQVISKINGIKTAFHLPLIHDNGYDLSCVEKQDEIEKLVNNLNTYKDALNLQHVISHPPEPQEAKQPMETSIDFLVENLKKLNMPVYLENIPDGTPPQQFYSQYLYVKEKLGSQLAGMCFDGPHYFVTGNDPVAMFHQFKDEIGCVHMSDCLEDDDVHLPFANGGVLPVEEIFDTIKSTDFAGYLTLEIKPKSLSDIPTYINSYTYALKKLHYSKYLTTSLKVFFIRPFIKKILN